MDFNEFTTDDCAVRARSKKEIYDFLWLEGNVLLPPISYCNHNFIKQIVKRWEEGEYPDLIKILQHIKGNDTKVCQVPIIKNLNVDEIIKFTREVWDIDQYIPEFDKKYPPRQWLCTVGIFVYSFIHFVNILAGEEFKKFIMSKSEKREKEIAMMIKLQVNASSEFVELFKNSKLKYRKAVNLFFISSISFKFWLIMEGQNGRFHYFLKSHRKEHMQKYRKMASERKRNSRNSEKRN